MAFIPDSGSVVAFQSNPSALQVLATVTNPTASVSGTVGASIIGLPPFVLGGSTNASVITVGTAAANQSVSGTVNIDGTVTVRSSISGGIFPVSGSVSAVVTNFPTTQNVSGSVVAWLTSTNASVITVGTAAPNQSVSGTVQVDNTVTVKSSIAGGIFPVSGSVAAVVTNFPTNTSVSGTVQVAVQASIGAVIIGGSVATATTNSSVMLLTSTNMVGSVAAYQGAVPWAVAGSVATYQAGTLVTSVVSTVPSSVLVGASIFGQLPAGTAVLGSVAVLQGTAIWNIAGSVASFGTSFSLSSVVVVAGSVISVPVGSVITVLQSSSIRTISNLGTNITSLVSTVPSSVIVGTSIFGQLPAGTAPIGSVAVLQGTNPWAETVVGSVITTFAQSPSIVGTYAEDVVHTAADKGVFILGVRNDAVTSIAGADRDYGPMATDDASRTITKPFAGETACIISYVGSTVSGSVQLIKGSVIGSKTYITDFWLSNTGATTTLVTFQDGTTSIMGQFIAPAGGGMASPGLAIPLKPVVVAGSDLCFKVAPSTSVLYVVVKGYQAP